MDDQQLDKHFSERLRKTRDVPVNPSAWNRLEKRLDAHSGGFRPWGAFMRWLPLALAAAVVGSLFWFRTEPPTTPAAQVSNAPIAPNDLPAPTQPSETIADQTSASQKRNPQTGVDGPKPISPTALHPTVLRNPVAASRPANKQDPEKILFSPQKNLQETATEKSPDLSVATLAEQQPPLPPPTPPIAEQPTDEIPAGEDLAAAPSTENETASESPLVDRPATTEQEEQASPVEATLSAEESPVARMLEIALLMNRRPVFETPDTAVQPIEALASPTPSAPSKPRIPAHRFSVGAVLQPEFESGKTYAPVRLYSGAAFEMALAGRWHIGVQLGVWAGGQTDTLLAQEWGFPNVGSPDEDYELRRVSWSARIWQPAVSVRYDVLSSPSWSLYARAGYSPVFEQGASVQYYFSEEEEEDEEEEENGLSEYWQKPARADWNAWQVGAGMQWRFSDRWSFAGELGLSGLSRVQLKTGVFFSF